MSALVTTREAMICQRRVRKEYEELLRNPLPNILVGLGEDPLDWYCLIYDLQEPQYINGEYIFHIKLSPRYPFEPPDFYFFTPNGRFELNKKLCFSNSSYHAESWSPIWTLRTIVVGFLSFFLEQSSKGVGHLTSTEEVKKSLADTSKEYNRNHLSDYLNKILIANGRS